MGIGFAGEWRDATGLINLRTRAYDPVLGRFIGRDSFSGIAGAPQTGNRYSYGLDNPMRFTDPSGRFVNKILLNPVVWATAVTIVVPELAIAWAVTTAITGTDPVTGEHVSSEGRFVAGAAAPWGSGARSATHSGKPGLRRRPPRRRASAFDLRMTL